MKTFLTSSLFCLVAKKRGKSRGKRHQLNGHSSQAKRQEAAGKYFLLISFNEFFYDGMRGKKKFIDFDVGRMEKYLFTMMEWKSIAAFYEMLKVQLAESLRRRKSLRGVQNLTKDFDAAF